MGTSHIDGGHFYEPNSVKIVVFCDLQVEIINVHLFADHPGSPESSQTTKRPRFCFYTF